MSTTKLLMRAVTWMLVVLLLVGCSGTPAEQNTAPAPVPTATIAAGPPCFSLVQAEKLPDWAGGLAFGENHSSSGGAIDLTSAFGCEVEGGVILINEDGRLFMAYMDNCENFGSSDISAQELRPASDQSWVCIQPAGDGQLKFTQRQG